MKTTIYLVVLDGVDMERPKIKAKFIQIAKFPKYDPFNQIGGHPHNPYFKDGQRGLWGEFCEQCTNKGENDIKDA